MIRITPPRIVVAIVFAILSSTPTLQADNAFLEGYSDYAEFTERVRALDASPTASVETLLTTVQKREVFAIKMGDTSDAMLPAILVVGNVHAPHIAGGELALRFAEELVAQKDDEAIKKALGKCRFYVIPRPAPDASEKAIVDGSREVTGNTTQTDDDRDNQIAEDGPEDLNGDGWITKIRVKRTGGVYRTHPDDDRLLVKSNPQKNEPGEYDVYLEGVDNDEDESWNEDASDGVDLNKNFPFAYPAFQKGAGTHACSEATSKALADFAYDHPEIQLVFTFSPQDNTFKPWKGDSKSDGNRIKTKIHSADAPFSDFMAERFRKIHEGKDAPNAAPASGSFVHWAYLHYGRWSLSTRGWWIPKIKPSDPSNLQESPKKDAGSNPAEAAGKDDPKATSEVPKSTTSGNVKSAMPKDEETTISKPSDSTKPKKDSAQSDEKKPTPKKKPTKLKQDNEELNALRWMEQNHVDGFVPWTKIDHPDFPDRAVEVGGFKPFWRLNPPATELEALGKKHTDFLVGLSELLPKLSVEDVKVKSLGGGIYRVSTNVTNTGYLPTASRMGTISRQTYPVQIHLELPDSAKLLHGSPRTSRSRIDGGGGKSEHTWLVKSESNDPIEARIHVWSLSVGETDKTIKIGESK